MQNYKFFLFIILSMFFSWKSIAQIKFESGTSFNYLKGNNALAIPSNWNQNSFDDSAWLNGNAPFRYGKGTGGTLLNDMRNTYSTLYLRSTFTAQSVDKLKKIKISANFDDGFVLWINGKEATRQNAPTVLTNSALASEIHEFNEVLSIEIDAEITSLVEGSNQIAVQVFNNTLASSDIYFDMSIVAEPELPRLEYSGEGISFSSKAGFYTSPFDLTISSSDPSCKVIYTIDGSNPASSDSRVVGGSSTIVRIDPAITQDRGNTPAFIVKACLFKEGFAPTFPKAATFIFAEKVKTQTSPGGNWPEWFVNNQIIDYEMATDITTDNRYKSEITAALLEIPTISLSTNLENIFGENQGIYVNASQKGEEWERECSLELINPNGDEGFMVNAGVRIRGGNSAKNGNNPKHAFRLFFRSEYGDSKLKFPLFGKNGADEFDCIDLRCEQNYSWSMDGDSHNTFIKDIFCRDIQGLMGQPHSRGNYYHLFLNGMYWGLFQTDERPESSFAATYFGGDKSDYDVVKVNTQPWPYYNEVTDGTMDSWEKVWNMCQSGFSSNSNYFKIEGKDATGERIDTATVWVDVDNLIDYMLVIFYSGNFDAPVSSWYSNDMPNNFFAIYNRENKSLGYKFIAHDSEHCMFVDNVNSEGVNENRVNIGSNGKMKISRVLDFNPQWLHFKLSDNAEYRLRFADRASKCFSEGGLLSPEKASLLFKKRAAEIDTAVIAESARWGDAQEWSGSLNKFDDWLPELNNLYDNYFPKRTDIVIQQLIDEDLYSSYSSPDILIAEEKINTDNYHFGTSLQFSIKRKGGSGEILFTLDGSDPRLVGGGIAGNAIAGGIQVERAISSTTIVNTRLKSGNSWGPLKKVLFIKENEDYSKLKVTELNYHPTAIIVGTDTTDDKSLEFIEFKNTGIESLDLSGIKLDSAVTFSFPENTILQPGGYYVIASKPNAFFSRYGKYPDGNYQGQFGNGGEYVLLTDRDGTEILAFTYSDKSPWPVDADGGGYSLTSVEENPTGNPNNYSYWKSSKTLNGSPFTNDDGSVGTGTIASGDNFFDVLLFPNPAYRSITVDLKNNNTGDDTVISIYRMDGKKVFENSVSISETIDLEKLNLNKGILLLKAVNGNRVVTKKFVFIP